MKTAKDFYQELDGYFARRNNQDTEAFLKRTLAQVEGSSLLIPVLNETACFYRGTNDWEKCQSCFQRLLGELDKAGIGGQNRAVCLLNLATAYRMMGRHTEAFATYDQVESLLRQEGDAYSLASLYNNRALLSLSTGDPEKALADLQSAGSLLETLPDSRQEQATTWSNIASACLSLGRLEEGEKAADQAIRLFEALGPDPHFGGALNSKAHFLYRRGDHAGAAALFERAAENTRQFFGENRDYRAAMENAANAKKRC